MSPRAASAAPAAAPAGEPLLSMRGIGKRFGAVRVLDRVDFEARAGEVHVLAGENGAGKSTLIKVLGGVHADYEGTISIGGVEVQPRTPREAAALGIAVIHQELSLVGTLTVADNLFLGRWPTRFGLVDRRKLREASTRALAELGFDVDPDRRVAELSPASRQVLEISKALLRSARVLVMDEPTSALAAPDVAALHRRLDVLRSRGCAIVYITHRMEEIAQVADRVTVLRDGRRVGSGTSAEVPARRLLRWMAGREAPEPFVRRRVGSDAPTPRSEGGGSRERLSVHELSVVVRGRPRVDRVSFAVGEGEILGLFGLQGSGASEILMAIFGGRIARGRTSTVAVDGVAVRVRSPREAIARGIALVTGDRQATGLVLPLSVAANLTLPALRSLSPWGLRRHGRERAVARQLIDALSIRGASPATEVGRLSGGNQQKVVLGKWLPLGPRVLLLDDPTRGVDVGAKREIYELLEESTRQGMAVVLVSSDLPELLALSDRVLVLHRGRATGLFARGEATAEALLGAAMGEVEPQAGVGAA